MAKKTGLGMVLVLLLGFTVLLGCAGTDSGNESNSKGIGGDNSENGKEVIVGDFSLTISVEETTLQPGQDIEVTAVLKNQSGKRHDVGRGFFWTGPFFIDSEHDQVRPAVAPQPDIFEIDGVITETWRIGSLLPKGKHTMIGRAIFDLLEIEDGKTVAVQPVLVDSTPIILTVY